MVCRGSPSSPRLIAHASVRYVALNQVMGHPFFKGVHWDDLRGTRAPFVPALDSEIDTGYYDDFTSPEDMAKYAEVKEKQKNVSKVKEKEVQFGRDIAINVVDGTPKSSAKDTDKLCSRQSLAGVSPQWSSACSVPGTALRRSAAHVAYIHI